MHVHEGDSLLIFADRILRNFNEHKPTYARYFAMLVPTDMMHVQLLLLVFVRDQEKNNKHRHHSVHDLVINLSINGCIPSLTL